MKARIQEENIYALSYRCLYPRVNVGSTCHEYLEAQIYVHRVINSEQNRYYFLAYCLKFSAVLLVSKYLIIKYKFFLVLPDIYEQTSRNIKVPLFLHSLFNELEAQSIILLEVLVVDLALA